MCVVLINPLKESNPEYPEYNNFHRADIDFLGPMLQPSAVARTLLDYVANGQATVFEQLRPALTGESALPPYAELAGRLDLSEGAVRVAVHRLRQRYGELLRQEIAQTVANAAEVKQELQHLLTALSP